MSSPLPTESQSQPEGDVPADAGAVEPKLRLGSKFATFLCWVYAVGAFCILALMRYAGERWWPATILLFSPRWFWALPFPLVALLALLRPRGRTLPLAIASAVVLLGIMGLEIPWRRALPEPTGHQKLRIVTCNLHNWHSNFDILSAFINQANPDIILFQDYTREREPLMVKRGVWYRRPCDGMYIASRFPIGNVENLIPRDQATKAYESVGLPLGKAQCFSVDLPGGRIHLVNLHLASAHYPLEWVRDGSDIGPELLDINSWRRGVESAAISKRIQEIGGPFIVAGDFNTPDDSIIFRKSWWRLRDAFTEDGFGFGATYARHHTWLRIDHLLSNEDWHCTDFQIGTDVGSGHRPILAVFER